MSVFVRMRPEVSLSYRWRYKRAVRRKLPMDGGHHQQGNGYELLWWDSDI